MWRSSFKPSLNERTPDCVMDIDVEDGELAGTASPDSIDPEAVHVEIQRQLLCKLVRRTADIAK
jgi:hypothetical protein